MSEALDRAVARLLTGIVMHADANELPPEAQEILEGRRGGAFVFVVWKEKRPLAVLVMLPAVPAFAAEVKQDLATILKELKPNRPTERKKLRRRRTSGDRQRSSAQRRTRRSDDG